MCVHGTTSLVVLHKVHTLTSNIAPNSKSETCNAETKTTVRNCYIKCAILVNCLSFKPTRFNRVRYMHSGRRRGCNKNFQQKSLHSPLLSLDTDFKQSSINTEVMAYSLPSVQQLPHFSDFSKAATVESLASIQQQRQQQRQQQTEYSPAPVRLVPQFR